MSDDKKPKLEIVTAQVLVKNDGGRLAREIAARVVEAKRLAAIEAIKTAQNSNSEQREQLKAPQPVSRKQRKQEARKLRKLANQSELEREELKRIITQKAAEAKVPFQIFVQRMMDSGKENLVMMAKIIRRIE